MRLQATEEVRSQNNKEDHLWARINIDQTLKFAIEYHNQYQQAKRILHFHQLIVVVLEESARISSSHLLFLRMELQLWVEACIIAIVKRISIITEVEVEAQVLRVVINI